MLELLEKAKALAGGGGYVFPGRTPRAPLSNMRSGAELHAVPTASAEQAASPSRVRHELVGAEPLGAAPIFGERVLAFVRTHRRAALERASYQEATAACEKGASEVVSPTG